MEAGVSLLSRNTCHGTMFCSRLKGRKTFTSVLPINVFRLALVGHQKQSAMFTELQRNACRIFPRMIHHRDYSIYFYANEKSKQKTLYTYSSSCILNRTIHQSCKHRRPSNLPTKDQLTYLDSISRSHVVVRIKDLDQHMRYHGHSVLGWGLLSLLLTLGFGVYMFREPIKENLSDEVADVATRSLGDENVVLKANEISQIVLHELMNDAKTQAAVSHFVVQILNRPDIHKAAYDLTMTVVNDPNTQIHVARLAGLALSEMLKTEWTRQLLLEYIKSILLDPATNQACQDLLNNLAKDEATKKIFADFFKGVLSSDTVVNQAVDLGKHVTGEIVGDRTIQEQTSNAIWNAFKFSITPSWWS